MFQGNLTVAMGKDKSPIEGKWMMIDPSKASVKRREEFSDFLAHLEKISNMEMPFMWDLKADA